MKCPTRPGVDSGETTASMSTNLVSRVRGFPSACTDCTSRCSGNVPDALGVTSQFHTRTGPCMKDCFVGSSPWTESCGPPSRVALTKQVVGTWMTVVEVPGSWASCPPAEASCTSTVVVSPTVIFALGGKSSWRWASFSAWAQAAAGVAGGPPVVPVCRDARWAR